jgi:hypothetical protein
MREQGSEIFGRPERRTKSRVEVSTMRDRVISTVVAGVAVLLVWALLWAGLD